MKTIIDIVEKGLILNAVVFLVCLVIGLVIHHFAVLYTKWYIKTKQKQLMETTYHIIIADNGMVVGTLEIGENIQTFKSKNTQFAKGTTYPITKKVAEKINKKFNFVK